MSIEESNFYKIVRTIAFFANWDTTLRLKHSLTAWCYRKSSGFEPHEILLGRTQKAMDGISSSLHYMRFSIAQISSPISLDRLNVEGFREYDLYRYHYIVFSHSIALLQDLLFRLAVTVFNLKIEKRLIGWTELSKELDLNNLTTIKDVFEKFYELFSKHIKKRNKFSHEGYLSYPTLDSFHLTEIWTQLYYSSNMDSCGHPEYIEGTLRNHQLLQESKNKFIEELSQLLSSAEQCVLSFYEHSIEKLLSQINPQFYEKHSKPIRECNIEYLNDYLTRIGL